MDTKFKNAKGKVIGKVSRGVFCKKVVKSKHLLRKWNAWGIDKEVIDNLIRNGIREILIHDKEENIDYETIVKDFVEKGIEDDFGHGKQIFLPLVNFKKEEEKEGTR